MALLCHAHNPKVADFEFRENRDAGVEQMAIRRRHHPGFCDHRQR
jgi:hypothetical protein